MSYFDFLHEKGITSKEGVIRMEPEEIVDEIALGNRLRQALLFEESEYYPEL